MKPRTDPAIVAQIQAEPVKSSPRALAEKYGVSVATVIRYRAAARKVQQETAKSILAADVETNLPGALGDLAELRKLSAEQYRRTFHPQDGALWARVIAITLDHVNPPEDGADLAHLTDEQLEHYAATGELPDPE